MGNVVIRVLARIETMRIGTKTPSMPMLLSLEGHMVSLDTLDELVPDVPERRRSIVQMDGAR